MYVCIYIYDVKFLALPGAPYIYDISRLRVNIRRVVFDSIYLLNFEITQRYGQYKYKESVSRPEIPRSQSDLSLAQSNASILLLKCRVFKNDKILFRFLGKLSLCCTNITRSKNHPTNVSINLYLYGQLILNVF
jgi:hypothetical protein